MKYLLVVSLNLLVCLIPLTGFGQEGRIDSLTKILGTLKEDSTKVNTLNALSNELLVSNDFTKSLSFAKEALALSERINFSGGKANSCYIIGYIYTYVAEYNNDDGLEYFLSAVSIWKINNNKSSLARAYYDIANIFGARGSYTEAIKNLYAGLALFEQVNDRKGAAGCVYYIGVCYSSQGDHAEALKNVYKALAIYQEFKDDEWIANCYNAIGEEKLALGNYTEALEVQLSALKIYGSLDSNASFFNIPNCYMSIGKIYEKEGDLASEKDNKATATVKYESALKNYLESLALWKKTEHAGGIAELNVKVGSLYIKLNNLSVAKNYLDKGLEAATKENLRELIKESYKSLSQIDSAQGKFKPAYEKYKMYIEYRDSLTNQETAKKLLQSKMQYEFDKKEAAGQSERIKKDAEIRRTRNLQFFIIGIFLLSTVFLFIYSRQKQKAKSRVEKAYEKLQATQAQLIQSEKMASLGNLTAGIAHEIQNPLNFVNNFSDVNTELMSELKEEANKGNIEEVKAIAIDVIENSKRINHHGKRAGAIVKGMLEHSRQGTGQKVLSDINALADEYLRLAYHGMRAKNQQLNATIKTDFDNSIEEINIVAQDIGRVLLNLYNNAFYTILEKQNKKIAGYEPMVTVSTRKLNGKVRITITDNGCGIPQGIINKIFVPFFTTKPTGSGTGLGLSLAYDIVKSYGGELNVKSTEGQFTEFVVTIPG